MYLIFFNAEVLFFYNSEVFIDADKYNVSIDPNYAENKQKVAIVATAITIDMVLKESK